MLGGEQVELVKKKRKLVKGLPKFNPPKQVNPPKQPPKSSVAFKRTNPLEPTQTQIVIEPSTSIHTTVHTSRSSQTIVAPSEKSTHLYKLTQTQLTLLSLVQRSSPMLRLPTHLKQV